MEKPGISYVVSPHVGSGIIRLRRKPITIRSMPRSFEISLRRVPLFLSAAALFGQWAAAQKITVQADKVERPISHLIYGAGTEDVNHEIYGGIYDQRIFGESFEEPAPGTAVRGMTMIDGEWSPVDSLLRGRAHDGGKAVFQEVALTDGSFSFELRFPRAGDAHSNAGAILRVANAAKGADAFDGYEVSLSSDGKRGILARHQQDFTPLKEAAVSTNPADWHKLRIDLSGPRVQVFLDGTPVIDFTDARPLTAGSVGFRTWKTDAEFRNPESNGKTIALAPRETPHVSGMWDHVLTGSAKAGYGILSGDAFNGHQAQVIRHQGGEGVVGIANRGLNRWGIAVRKGNTYPGSLYLRGNARVRVSLQSADGKTTHASQDIASNSSEWCKTTFALSSNATDANARFAITLDQPGEVMLDQVVLMGPPSEQYEGLPLRRDIAEAMKSQGLTFLRYGGTMINAPEYRWKKMLGDRDKRPPYRGHWYRHSTNGFGIEEFLQWCEKSGYVPSFAINVEETPEDMADMIEYLNGPATSKWGKQRASNGHPEPYGVKYVEIGNEEVIWADNAADYDHYIERFKLLAAAMKKVDPTLQLINAAWWRGDNPSCEKVYKELDGLAAYWDFHTWADDPNSGREVDKILSEARGLFKKWKPDGTMDIVIFEENGNRHDMARALGHATTLNSVRRHGIPLDSAANALQPWLQNDNGWDQGQVFFTPDKAWLMPPAYAQQMASGNHLPLLVKSEVSGTQQLDVTATRSKDAKTLVLHVVNVSKDAVSAGLMLDAFPNIRPEVRRWTLSGDLNARNTPDEPEKVVPVTDTTSAAANQTFPPHSYTVLRFESANP